MDTMLSGLSEIELIPWRTNHSVISGKSEVACPQMPTYSEPPGGGDGSLA